MGSPIEPDREGDTITLYGGGPECPGCGGPTHAVTGDREAQRPWWCMNCEVRLDEHGNVGPHASFPKGSKPGVNDG